MVKEGKSWIKPCFPNFKRRARWDSNIKTIRIAKWGDSCEQVWIGTHKRVFQPMCHLCPQCKASSPSTHTAFQNEDLDKIYKCTTCKKSSKINDWLCSCHIRWHLCDSHSVEITQASKRPPKSEPIAKQKRQIGPLTKVDI